MLDFLALILGVVCAGVGGELFVRGGVGLAKWARISPGIIGATVVAFGTSSPELSVSVNSALAGTPQIGLGDALGSNVLNVALILGVTLLISQTECSRQSIQRDFPVALAIPVITGVLILDGRISRLDGFLLLGMFAAWLVATIIEVRRQRSAAAAVVGEPRRWMSIVECAAGLAVLIAGGTLIVRGATGIAAAFGIEEFVIAATVVAVGTSAPELATAVVAKLRGHDEIGLGTILGSNIFNGIFIIAVLAIIHPIAVDWRDVLIALVFGLVALAFSYPERSGLIRRRRGAWLLVLFVVYVAVALQGGGG
ncbi:MAG TPA: sodium:calcium antiporter [Gammaproteobacteria bacterium]|jgi:cation:H+ antiporter